MSYSGSPLGIAVVSVSSLDDALSFYRDVIGLDATEEVTWAGADFEQFWHLPKGSRAKAVYLSSGDLPVGAILLLEFDDANRVRVREESDRSHLGLWNLNFYVDDIFAASKDLQAKGFTFWSDPVAYEVDKDTGQPIEVVFDGPDHLAINLVQLAGDPGTEVGSMKQQTSEIPNTPTGYSPVATTSHCVNNVEGALAFYQKVCGMDVIIDAVLGKPETNRFLNRPPDAQSRAVFVRGYHPYGKVALSHPLNYDVPNRISRAVPPNIGYLAQGFYLGDLEQAQQTCAEIGAEVFTELTPIDIPFVGNRRSMIVRNPGSGALMQLIEQQE